MKVAAIQMVAGSDLDANLDHAYTLFKQAAQLGAELAALPEYFCLIGVKDTDKLAIAEPVGEGKIQRFLSQTARELKLWIVGGTLPLATSDPGHVRNSVLVYAPSGELVTRYDKIHLFRYDNGRERYDESHVLERGHQPVSFDLPSKDGHTWRIGLSVCYDMRFPELYRSQPVDAWLVPSAFTYTTGRAHWEVLLRARAIENLAYVIAPAQGGVHPTGRRTWGHSMVVEPWGDVLAVLAEGEGVVMADLDASHLQDVRRQLPALQHRVL
ncbi:MAG: carbon-nitrogen hydrolase family protein [Burkholderiaceae bacterium]|nr:carbon-nitrogen hydrolase family protein [Burkholderiaceae bacterium]